MDLPDFRADKREHYRMTYTAVLRAVSLPPADPLSSCQGALARVYEAGYKLVYGWTCHPIPGRNPLGEDRESAERSGVHAITWAIQL